MVPIYQSSLLISHLCLPFNSSYHLFVIHNYCFTSTFSYTPSNIFFFTTQSSNILSIQQSFDLHSYPFVCPFILLSIPSSIHQPTCIIRQTIACPVSLYASIHSHIYTSISIYLSSYPASHLSLNHPSVHPSIPQFTHPSINPSIHPTLRWCHKETVITIKPACLNTTGDPLPASLGTAAG